MAPFKGKRGCAGVLAPPRYNGAVSTLLLGMALLLLIALIAIDLVVMRHADRFDGTEPEPSQRVWPQQPPPLVKAGAYVSLVLGAVSFPATLAPVVMTVLTFQRHRLLSEAWVSLAAMIVATLSMSAAIKGLRMSHLLRHLTAEMRPLLRSTAAYLVLWELLVVFLGMLMRPPSGDIAVLIWSYLAANTLGTALVVAAARVGLEAGEGEPATV